MPPRPAKSARPRASAAKAKTPSKPRKEAARPSKPTKATRPQKATTKPAEGVVVRTRKAKPKPPSAKPAPKAEKAPPKKPARPRVPVQKTRIVFPKDVYESRKDEIKAPLKESGLKWQYLGEGKGRYHKEGVNLFAQFLDDGTHYSLWGDDKATIERLTRAWRSLLGEDAWKAATTRGEEAVAEEKKEAESEALRIWRIGEPQRQPGEPEFFFKRRHAEWEARKPTS